MLIRTVKTLFLLFLVVALNAGNLLAQDAEDRPLTDDRVKGFCAAMTDLLDWAEANKDRFSDEDWDAEGFKGEEMATYLNSMGMMNVRVEEVREAFDKIIRRHGFSSAEDWESTSGRIVAAWADVKLGASKGEMLAGMMGGLSDELLANLPEAERAQIKAAMEEAKAQLNEFESDVPPADLIVVKRNMSLLESFFGQLSER